MSPPTMPIGKVCVLLVGLPCLVACAAASPDGATDLSHPPQVTRLAYTLDSVGQTASLDLAAEAGGTPVQIACSGPWQGGGINSYQVIRPFAELRFIPLWAGDCTLTAGDSSLVLLGLGDFRPPWVDRAPTPTAPLALDSLRAGLPVRFVAGGADDWDLTGHQLLIAPGPLANATCGPWTTAAQRPVAGRMVRDTLEAVFPDPGDWCVTNALEDDNGHGSGYRIEIHVE